MTSQDAVERFFATYETGDPAAALRNLLDNASMEHDALADDGTRPHAVLSFADALAFGTTLDVLWTGRHLTEGFAVRSQALAFDLFMAEIRRNPGLAGDRTNPTIAAIEPAVVDALKL